MGCGIWIQVSLRDRTLRPSHHFGDALKQSQFGRHGSCLEMCQVSVFPGSALLPRAIPLASTPSLRLRKMSTPPGMRTAAVPEDIIRSDIWFSDGNIVLVARETAFRIYRRLLAGQSTVFSDMFASSTSSPDETFDGCPVVHLSDSPHDLAHLLRVLLPKSHIQ